MSRSFTPSTPLHNNVPDFLHSTYGIAGISIALYILWKWSTSHNPNLDAIPTIGYDGPILSYLSAFRYIFHAKDIIEEGYEKYKGGVFKVAFINRWMVVVSGPKLIDDMRRAPEDQLSFFDAIEETIQSEYTFGPEIHLEPYHISAVRSQLTRNLGNLFSEVRDEIGSSFSDVIPTKGSEWVKVPAIEAVMNITCRTSNRIFVGLPLCRNADFGSLNVHYAISVMASAAVINLFPNFLKPLAARYFTNINRSVNRAMKHLQPLYEYQQQKREEYGTQNWPEKPNNMVSWLLDEAPENSRTLRDLALRVLTVNFAAIHTSSISFTHALYHLAANSEYQRILRNEVKAVVAQEGWTKTAMGKMQKLDSFIKESQRVNGLSVVNMDRKVLKPFTFSDGTHLPEGAFVSVAAQSTHSDGSSYPNADTFDAFRFSDMRASEGEGTKHSFVTTGVDYIPFGHGRHACPGRFFASNELKAMFAHLLVTYDVKFENEGVRPPNQWFAGNCVPNQKAEVMFRKRQQ